MTPPGLAPRLLPLRGPLVADPRDASLLSTADVIDSIRSAVVDRRSLSLIRMGDGENICAAQDAVLPAGELAREAWSKYADRNGFFMPNLAVRDHVITALRHADIVGVHPWNDRVISAPARLKRALAERVFAHYSITPTKLCDASVSRLLPQEITFWEALRGRRLLLISKWAPALKPILQRAPYRFTSVHAMRFSWHEETHPTLARVRAIASSFDVALVSCGVSALFLATEIAAMGKVAIDFGQSAYFMTSDAAGLSGAAGLNKHPLASPSRRE